MDVFGGGLVHAYIHFNLSGESVLGGLKKNLLYSPGGDFHKIGLGMHSPENARTYSQSQ
jgi:hypothetical protein